MNFKGVSIVAVFILLLNYTVDAQIPVADFQAGHTKVFQGRDIQFTDLSTNNPTTWNWIFQGGSPGSSIQQDPLIIYNNAGQFDVSLEVSNSNGTDNISVVDLIKVYQWPSLPSNACDTVSNFSVSNDDLTLYESPGGLGWGYSSGHNNYGDQSKADKFSGLNVGDMINGVVLGFGVAEYADSNSTIDVNVWDDLGSGGRPGSILSSETITIKSIADDLSNNTFTYVSFASPVSISVGADYYIGISFTYASGDTVALYLNEDGQGDSTAWEQFASGLWLPFSSPDSSWDVHVSHFIAPLVCAPCSTFSASVNSIDVSCGLQNGEATATGNGGMLPYTYEWSDGQNSAIADSLAVGSYTVTVTDSNGCVISKTANIFNSGYPSAKLVNKTNVSCNGESDGAMSVIVTGGIPGYTFNWSSGDTSIAISDLEAGVYNLTVEDIRGCTTTFIDTIFEPELMSISVDNITNVTNETLDNGAIYIGVTGGTEPYSFSWSNNESDQNINGLAIGTYMVTATDTNGCFTTASAEVGNSVAIIDVVELIKFDLYPNPTNSIINLKLELEINADVQIEWVNLIGTVVYSEDLGTTTLVNKSFDLGQLTSGIYFAKITIGKETKVRKVVLNK